MTKLNSSDESGGAGGGAGSGHYIRLMRAEFGPEIEERITAKKFPMNDSRDADI